MRLQILGSLNLDLIQEVATLPRPGETVLAVRTSQAAGGKGANQATAAARYGAATVLHAAVGADEAGGRLVANLASEGVEVSNVKRLYDQATGRAYVTVAADGQNMIVVDSGANQDAAFDASSVSGKSLFLTQLETPVSAALAMFAIARPGDLRILNTAPAVAEGRALFPHCDLMVMNQGELCFYAGVEAAAAAEIAALAQGLLTHEDQHIVVTLGAAGAMIVGSGTLEHVPTRVVTVKDSTGAGDCFIGVLAAALAEGASLRSAAEVGCLAAALSVQTLGANSAPTRSEIQAHSELTRRQKADR